MGIDFIEKQADRQKTLSEIRKRQLVENHSGSLFDRAVSHSRSFTCELGAKIDRESIRAGDHLCVMREAGKMFVIKQSKDVAQPSPEGCAELAKAIDAEPEIEGCMIEVIAAPNELGVFEAKALPVREW